MAVVRSRCDVVALRTIDVPSSVDEFDFEATLVRVVIAINIVVPDVDCRMIEAATMMLSLRTIFDCGNSIERSEMKNEHAIMKNQPF